MYKTRFYEIAAKVAKRNAGIRLLFYLGIQCRGSSDWVAVVGVGIGLVKSMKVTTWKARNSHKVRHQRGTQDKPTHT
jgi:hypothetical protein